MTPDPRIVPLRASLRLNTRLLLNCLDGVSDEVARRRPGDGNNSIAYVVLHLHDARHYLARYLGADEPDPFAAITAEAQGIDDIEVYPSLSEARTAWMEISAVVDSRVSELSGAELERVSPAEAPEFPVEDRSILGGIAFLLQHEAYHLGQLAFLRKYYGLPAMSWKV